MTLFLSICTLGDYDAGLHLVHRSRSDGRDSCSTSLCMPSLTWVVSFLRGQARAYRRRKISRTAVWTAARIATKHRAPPAEIAEVLREYGLSYNAETDTITELEGAELISYS